MRQNLIVWRDLVWTLINLFLLFLSGLMGMEALETVVGYWEDALNGYQSSGRHKFLSTSEEAEFSKMLETILEAAYQLQVTSKNYASIDQSA
jgi:hypothetical protein